MKFNEKKTASEERIYILIFAFLTSILISFFFYNFTSLHKKVDNSIYDFYLTSSKRADVSDRIVLADIDEASLTALGQWPWPRYRVATLLQSLSQHDPAQIGLDIIFPEPDNTSLNTIKRTFNRDFGIDIGISNLPIGLDNNDSFLGKVISESQTIGSKYFFFDHTNKQTQCFDKPTLITGETNDLDLPEASGVLCNIEPIDTSFINTGFINNQFDNDGVLRKMSLLIKYQGQIYPNLSLSLLAHHLEADSIKVSRDIFGNTLTINDFIIPINQKGEYQLRYPGPGRSHRTISALELLNFSIKTPDIMNKIVLIGVSAVGLGDRHHTVFDSSFPGTETHAVFLSNVLNEQFIRTPEWSLIYVTILTLLTGILIAFSFYRFSPISAATVACSLIILQFIVYFIVFTTKGLFFSTTSPVFMAISMVIICSLLLYLVENQNALAWHRELAKVQQVTLDAMVTVAESRDPDTGGHIQRTKRYAKVLASSLQKRERFKTIVTDDFIQALFDSVPLHDVGKVSIPDLILMKPGPLNHEEFEIMKNHSEYGRVIIESAAIRLSDKHFLVVASEIAASHHEKWDGSGYPLGLKGDNIPLSGRIMAVVDVYDALISRRHYKDSYSHELSKQIMVEKMPGHFDPALIEAFLDVEEEFEEISIKFNNAPSLIS